MDRRALPTVERHQQDFDRAIMVMELLSRRGKHRGPSISDLLVSAVAERAGLCVIHYDRDVDLIASVTGQDVEWSFPASSVP